MHQADNAHASMVTIMLERAGDLPAVRDVVLDFRVALRNLRDRRAQEDGRWRQMAVVGIAELDLLSVEDIPLLPPSRRSVIAELPVRSHDEDFTVVIHVHLAVSHPMIPRHAVERAFQQQWKGTGRVDVREFRDEVTAPENAGGIIAYASKFEMTTMFHGNIECPVPMMWQARLWGWLHGLRCGLAPLRVRMSAMRDSKKPAVPVQPSVSGTHGWAEPMPVVIG